MNLGLEEGKQLIADILNGLEADPPVQDANELLVIFGTPFITLKDAAKMVYGNNQVQIAAQNCYSEESGAYTGEIKWIKKEYMERTHAFFEKHGGKTIFLALAAMKNTRVGDGELGGIRSEERG